jgi:hypothetical protein
MHFKTSQAVGALALTAALAATTEAAAQSKPPLTRKLPTETVDIHEDEILPAQPTTLSERVMQVDAIVRGRVQLFNVRSIRKVDLPPGVDPKYGLDVYTDHSVTVLEVLKADPRLPASGRLQVAQAVGEAVVDGVRVRRKNDTFQQFAPGDEYVFFLRWDPSRERFRVLASDAFRLVDGKVESQGHAGYAKQSSGITKADFLTQLREVTAPR